MDRADDVKNSGSIVATGQHIFLTGASGGLGMALAKHYAKTGVRLTLWGRDGDRLNVLAEACRKQGAKVHVLSLDITDLDSTLVALKAADQESPIDLAIFASGSGDIRASGDLVEDAEMVMRLGLVNFVAPTTMAAELAARMVQRGGGSLVLVGSVAAFHALPFAAAYSGTKAGLVRFAQALRLQVRQYGVRVTLVSPGFIDTAAGRAVPGPKPLLMTPSHVAACIARAVEKNKSHAIMPRPFALLRVLDRLMPARFRDRVLLALSPPNC